MQCCMRYVPWMGCRWCSDRLTLESADLRTSGMMYKRTLVGWAETPVCSPVALGGFSCSLPIWFPVMHIRSLTFRGNQANRLLLQSSWSFFILQSWGTCIFSQFLLSGVPVLHLELPSSPATHRRSLREVRRRLLPCSIRRQHCLHQNPTLRKLYIKRFTELSSPSGLVPWLWWKHNPVLSFIITKLSLEYCLY